MNTFTIPAPPSPRRLILEGRRIIFLAVIYFVTAEIGLNFFDAVNGFASLVWPPSGIALAALLLFGYRVAPGVFIGAFFANLVSGAPFIASIGIGIGNTIEAVLATYLLERILHFTNIFRSERDVLGYFLLAAFLPTMLAATIGSGILWVSHVVPVATFGVTWRAWWIGDMLSVMIFAPLILLWFNQPRISLRTTDIKRNIEGVSVAILFLLTNAYAFTELFSGLFGGDFSIDRHLYFVFLPLLWIALRFGGRITILATFSTAVIAIFGTIQGWAPFSGGTLSEELYQTQIFLLFTVGTMLMTTTMVASSRRTEEELGDQGVTFTEAQALSRTGSWELDHGNLKWSDELYRIYGFLPQEEKVSRETFVLHAHPDDRELVRKSMNDAFDRHKMIDIHYRIIRPDGEARYLHAMAKSIEGKGWMPKVIGISKDITDRVTAELGLKTKTEELEKALEELQKSDTAKTHFLAVLSHELRNPLAPILSAVELLQLRDELDSENKKSIAIIARQVNNIKALLGDLLDLTRIEQGKIQLRKKHIDIRDVITRAAETALPTIESRKHQFTVTIPERPVILFGDSLRLEQALVNLIYNASKFSDPGSVISVSCVEQEKTISISVKDNGIGIEPQFLTKIFEPFSGFDRPAASLRGGLGIGLKLVKALVELHGGNVKANSQGTNTGSEFTIQLPKAMTSEKNDVLENTSEEKQTPATQKWKVLVVDDNRAAASTLSTLLRHLGYDARHAFSGASTMGILNEFAPHIFLLDIGMPDMDGYELARQIRSLYFRDDAILIAVSGYGQYEDQKRARMAGFNDHLTKPVSSRDIEALFQKHIANLPGMKE